MAKPKIIPIRSGISMKIEEKEKKLLMEETKKSKEPDNDQINK